MKSTGAFYRFCLEVTRGEHPGLSGFGHDFAEDFVRPALSRSPRSLDALLTILSAHGSCDEAVEGGRDAWEHFIRLRGYEDATE